jgi:predicted nucleic acid-binding protein
LQATLSWFDEQHKAGRIRFVALTSPTFEACLRVVGSSRGELDFNDARLVVMRQNEEIGAVASFDADFESVDGFELIS